MAQSHKLVVIGNIGNDAGYWVWEPGKGPRHVGGWGPEALHELAVAARLVAQASTLKTPGLAHETAKGVAEFVTKQVSEHIGEGATTVVIVNAGG